MFEIEIEGIRPEVQRFAESMNKKLLANKHKGIGWKHDGLLPLLARLKEEVAELEEAISKGDPDLIQKEAADVGNFAMFIADNSENLRPPKTQTSVVPMFDLCGPPCPKEKCSGVLIDCMSLRTHEYFRQCSVCKEKFDKQDVGEKFQESIETLNRILEGQNTDG